MDVLEDSLASSTSKAVANLLKDAFKPKEEPLLDHWCHISGLKTKQNEPPCPINVHLHYYKVCLSTLNQARTQQWIKIQSMIISVFPHFTAKATHARAALNNVRHQLRELNLPGLRFGFVSCHP